MSLRLGALFQAMEHSGDGFGSAFGALAGFRSDVPGALDDWLELSGKFTSGAWNDNFAAFNPISSISQGEIFSGTQGGLALLEAGYHARMGTVLAGGILRYFIKTWDDPATDGKLCGAEIWGKAAWQPFDDLRLGMGAGAFFPGMGNAELYEGKTQWKLSFDLTLSF